MMAAAKLANPSKTIGEYIRSEIAKAAASREPVSLAGLVEDTVAHFRAQPKFLEAYFARNGPSLIHEMARNIRPRMCHFWSALLRLKQADCRLILCLLCPHYVVLRTWGYNPRHD